MYYIVFYKYSIMYSQLDFTHRNQPLSFLRQAVEAMGAPCRRAPGPRFDSTWIQDLVISFANISIEIW